MTQEEMLSQMESMLQPLQQVNASQTETIRKLTLQNESLQSRIKELTAQVAWLNRQLFGRKSEKLPIIDSNYPDLFAGMLPDNAQQISDSRDQQFEELHGREGYTGDADDYSGELLQDREAAGKRAGHDHKYHQQPVHDTVTLVQHND